MRHNWGPRGLDEKEARLLNGATAPMIENFDRFSSFILGPLPNDFVTSRDVTNPELLVQLKRLYLIELSANRASITWQSKTIKDWDGGDLHEATMSDPIVDAYQGVYCADIQAKIAAIDPATLTDAEKVLAQKASFEARGLKRPYNHLGRTVGYLYSFAQLYNLSDVPRIFTSDDEFLLAFNAVTFHHPEWMNVGSIP